MGQPLERRDGIIDKDKPVEKRFKLGLMLLKPVLCERHTLRLRSQMRPGQKPGRIFKIAVKPVVAIFRLRKSEEDTTGLHLTRVDSKRTHFAC